MKTKTSTAFGAAEFASRGFAVVNAVYTSEEITAIASCIEQATAMQGIQRGSTSLFALRQFLKEVPAAAPLIFNANLCGLLAEYGGPQYVPVKSIYFDKPADANWFVPFHQDLSIAVNERIDAPGYGPWTVKQNLFGVQPPQRILENILTLRIHLDDTNEENGALRVLEGTHRRGIFRAETLHLANETEHVCRVETGGVMLMKPLLMHASHRSRRQLGRRVIHIECSDQELDGGLCWAERTAVLR